VRELYQVVEVGPSWYQDNIPCQEACPVKTNCRGYLNLAAAGEFEKAWELALDPNPLASICGSVCAAPCETACRRKEVDKPLSIRYVKKSVPSELPPCPATASMLSSLAVEPILDILSDRL
jgi:formate dehydrogenase beta subunit